MTASPSPPELLAAFEKMRRAKAAILMHSRDGSLADIVRSDREAFAGTRLLFASDHAGAPLQAIVQSEDTETFVANVFCGRGLLAYSDHIDTFMTQGEAQLTFATLAIVDINLLSDLPKFFTGKPITTRDKIGKTLEFIDARLGRSFDWTFASLENMREALKPNNPWPYRKIAAIKRYCHTPDAFRADQPWADTEINEFLPEAETHWRNWLRNGAAWHHVDRRDLIYALALKAMLECWSGSSTERGLSRLTEFCLDELGLIPLKELYFAWRALLGFEQKTSHLSIFDETPLKEPGRESLDRISALAWDLFLFRWCETIMTQTGESTFYVPVVTTLDTNLLRTIKACPLRALLINEQAGLVNAIFDDELVFHQHFDECLSADLRRRIEDPQRLGRREQISRHALSARINQLEKEVNQLI